MEVTGLTVRTDRALIALALLGMLVLCLLAPGSQRDRHEAFATDAAASNEPESPQPCASPSKHLMHQGGGNARTVHLTFDDGPGPHTAAVLRILAAEKVRATFFVVGRQVKSRPEIVKRASAAGHEIGNHSFDHHIPRREAGWNALDLASEISRTQAAVLRVTDKVPCAFRPPGGVVKGGRQVARDANLSVVLWSVDTRDWTGAGAASIRREARRGLRQQHPVILLHDGGANRGAMLKALPAIIADYRAHGYKFALVSSNG